MATLGFDERDFFYTGLEKKKKMLVPCRISPETGLKVLLPVSPLLRNKGWEVVGFGDLQEHSIAEVFDRFLGRVGPDVLMQEFQDTRFLVDPSWIEGLGLVALEASACGVVPIITARADYVDLFNNSIKPFFELPNFIDTEKLIIFLEKFITNKYKNKVIILDNASSHRNEKIKQLINKNNKILYSIPYQHYTNSIEQFFSKLKSGLQKKKGLKYEELKRNIIEVIKNIPIIFYYKILKGSYDRKKLYSKKKTYKRKYKTYIE